SPFQARSAPPSRRRASAFLRRGSLQLQGPLKTRRPRRDGHRLHRFRAGAAESHPDRPLRTVRYQSEAAVTDPMTNPFDRDGDPDRHYIWQHLIALDSNAFVLGDWSMIEGDFDADDFEGIRCEH